MPLVYSSSPITKEYLFIITTSYCYGCDLQFPLTTAHNLIMALMSHDFLHMIQDSLLYVNIIYC